MIPKIIEIAKEVVHIFEESFFDDFLDARKIEKKEVITILEPSPRRLCQASLVSLGGGFLKI